MFTYSLISRRNEWTTYELCELLIRFWAAFSFSSCRCKFLFLCSWIRKYVYITRNRFSYMYTLLCRMSAPFSFCFLSLSHALYLLSDYGVVCFQLACDLMALFSILSLFFRLISCDFLFFYFKVLWKRCHAMWSKWVCFEMMCSLECNAFNVSFLRLRLLLLNIVACTSFFVYSFCFCHSLIFLQCMCY